MRSVNLRTVWGLLKRDLRRYFGNPTGYVFITLFILLSAIAAFWRPRFFLNNLATLDQINEVYPYLLLLFVPALTMGVWADERKQGTDELLLTLPATDLEIVLGKYAAVLSVYTVSLLLSLSHVAVLRWLGHPDPGLMIANYIGYWLAGAALIAVGMFGSLLTANLTVAFILAAAFCAVPVLLDQAGRTFSDVLGRLAAPLGIFQHFSDFTRGVVSLAGFVYFASLTAVFLYLNVVVLGRRHWTRSGDRLPMGMHHGIRAAALFVALAAVNLLAERVDARLDVTAERLHSIGAETRTLLAGLSPERPVIIQAFVSPEVPEEYVQQRQSLLSALREIQALAGPRVAVRIDQTLPYSEAARTARERFGIVPRFVTDPGSTSSDPQGIFLGLAFRAGADEQVLPFLENGMSAEYELARSIRVVARTERKRIGIVDTDAKVFGGMDFETGSNRLPWEIVNEIRKQYDVVQITPFEPIEEKVDALLVVLPSTLLNREMTNVFDAIRRGVPTLLVVDPVPAMDMRLAPAAPMAARMNPYANPAMALTRKNVGDIQKALAAIGVTWPPVRVVWDSYRPNAEISQLPREVVLVAPGSGNAEAFNRSHPATAGLQQVLMLYAGALSQAEASGLTFTPLLATGTLSGTESYFQLVQPSAAGPVLNPNVPHEPQNQVQTLAAQITGTPAGGQAALHVIVIADLDFISDQYFVMRANAPAGAAYDNVTFFLNSLDVLANDESFIALRKRRPRYRTLERVEAQTRAFLERRTQEEQQATSEAQAALEAAQNNLKKMVEAVEQRTDLDAQARQILVRNLQETENRKLEVLRTNIQQARDNKVQASRERMETEVRRIQGTIRTAAAVLPPLPMFVLGIVVFFRRRQRAREGALAVRRLRDQV